MWPSKKAPAALHRLLTVKAVAGNTAPHGPVTGHAAGKAVRRRRVQPHHIKLHSVATKNLSGAFSHSHCLFGDVQQQAQRLVTGAQRCSAQSKLQGLFSIALQEKLVTQCTALSAGNKESWTFWCSRVVHKLRMCFAQQSFACQVGTAPPLLEQFWCMNLSPKIAKLHSQRTFGLFLHLPSLT